MPSIFSKMFSSSGTKNSGSSAQVKSHGTKGKSKAVSAHDQNDNLANREMMATADRELYQFDAPTQTLGLSDLIAKHKPGDRFQYLALTGGESETYEARLRRMVTFRPRVSKSMINIDDLPHIKLIHDSETMPLVSVLPKKGEEYIRVHAVSGYFAPTMSVMAKFSKVKIALMDSRFDPPAEVQSITMNTNIDAKIELSMDYCIPRTAASKLSLIVSREQATIAYGEQWGALQAQIQLEQSSFPYMSDMRRVVGILGPTASALEDHDVNPNQLDITMTEGNRRMMREMYQQGDLADESEPIVIKKKATTYAKSSIKALPKGSVPESSGLDREGWSFMKDMRVPQSGAEVASVDPDEDDEEDDSSVGETPFVTKQRWEEEQEKLRKAFSSTLSDSTAETFVASPPPSRHQPGTPPRSASGSHTLNSILHSENDESPKPIKRLRGVHFGAGNV